MKVVILSTVLFFFSVSLGNSPGFAQDKKDTRRIQPRKIVSPQREESEQASKFQEKINQIKSDYLEKKISLEQAKKALGPLVEEELKNYFLNLDKEIAALEKRLQFLKKGKVDHSSVIEERIKEILGVVLPEDNLLKIEGAVAVKKPMPEKGKK
jgi:hypothetical protein